MGEKRGSQAYNQSDALYLNCVQNIHKDTMCHGDTHMEKQIKKKPLSTGYFWRRKVEGQQVTVATWVTFANICRPPKSKCEH